MSPASDHARHARPDRDGTPHGAVAAVVLAAGKGTRMRSDLPKVVHAAAGRPMVRWVVEACRGADAAPIVLVVGHQAERVEAIFEEELRGTSDPDIAFATQAAQLGTGHAVLQAEDALRRGAARTCLVLNGDGPLVRSATLRSLLRRHRESGAAATLATATLGDPTGYGRIVRDPQGRFLRIREQKDASPEELAIAEINPGYYCFEVAPLFDALHRVGRANASGEIYLTDVFEILRADGRVVALLPEVPADEVLSVNTPEQLQTVSRILLDRGALPAAAAARPDHA